jgi:hypothetical protein
LAFHLLEDPAVVEQTPPLGMVVTQTPQVLLEQQAKGLLEAVVIFPGLPQVTGVVAQVAQGK